MLASSGRSGASACKQTRAAHHVDFPLWRPAMSPTAPAARRSREPGPRRRFSSSETSLTCACQGCRITSSSPATSPSSGPSVGRRGRRRVPIRGGTNLVTSALMAAGSAPGAPVRRAADHLAPLSTSRTTPRARHATRTDAGPSSGAGRDRPRTPDGRSRRTTGTRRAARAGAAGDPARTPV